VLAEATAASVVDVQFKARLAIGQLEMASGQTEAGRQRLRALAREASAKGFRLIARKARAAAAGT
jgi:hypothetical protein